MGRHCAKAGDAKNDGVPSPVRSRRKRTASVRLSDISAREEPAEQVPARRSRRLRGEPEQLSPEVAGTSAAWATKRSRSSFSLRNPADGPGLLPDVSTAAVRAAGEDVGSAEGQGRPPEVLSDAEEVCDGEEVPHAEEQDTANERCGTGAQTRASRERATDEPKDTHQRPDQAGGGPAGQPACTSRSRGRSRKRAKVTQAPASTPAAADEEQTPAGRQIPPPGFVLKVHAGLIHTCS